MDNYWMHFPRRKWQLNVNVNGSTAKVDGYFRFFPARHQQVQHPKVLNLVPRGLIQGDWKSFVIRFRKRQTFQRLWHLWHYSHLTWFEFSQNENPLKIYIYITTRTRSLDRSLAIVPLLLFCYRNQYQGINTILPLVPDKYTGNITDR